jgi:hypothetical protein
MMRTVDVTGPVELSELEIRAVYTQAVMQGRKDLPELAARLVAGLDESISDPPGSVAPVHAEQPVFVDATGRRRSLARKAGLLLGPLLFGYAVVLGVSMGATADVPMITWVAPAEHKPVPRQVKRKVVKKRGPSISARLKKSAPKRSVKASPTPASKIRRSASPHAVPAVTATPSAVPSPSPAPTPTHAPLGESKNRDNT